MSVISVAAAPMNPELELRKKKFFGRCDEAQRQHGELEGYLDRGKLFDFVVDHNISEDRWASVLLDVTLTQPAQFAKATPC